MRLVVGLFAMFLTASVARADEAKAPEPKPEAPRAKVPLRVVRILPESHQALLFDRNRGTHVLADVGGTIDGYMVEEIDDDEVTLSSNGREIVLAAPAEEPVWRRGGRRDRRTAEAEPTRAPKKAAEIAPVDPYAEAAPAADAPIDPYAETPVRAASAAGIVIAPGENGVRTVSASPEAPIALDPVTVPPPSAPIAAPTATAPAIITAAPIAEPMVIAPAKPGAKAAKKPAKKGADIDLSGFLPPGTSADDAATPPAPAAAPAPAKTNPYTAPKLSVAAPDDPYGDEAPAPAITPAPVAPAPVAAPIVEGPPAPVITPVVLSRSELNASIADFGKLTQIVRGNFTADGARLDYLADGTVFAKAGLKRGDIITSVDGAPLKSIDDAAELYVRAEKTRAANIQVIRNGKPLTLRVLIQ